MRIITLVVLIVAAAIAAGPLGAAAPSPQITPGSFAGVGAFTIVLHGASDPAGPPTVTPTMIIVAVPGTLVWRSVRYPRPLRMLTDIVVAQHDPGMVWVVAHLAGASAHVPLEIVPGSDGLTLTFGGSGGSASVPASVPAQRASRAVPTFSVRWTHVPVSDVIAVLVKMSGVRVSADSRLTGSVTLRMDSASLNTVLGAVARQVHGRVVHSGAGYRLVP